MDEKRIIAVDGARLSVTVEGQGDPVFLLHGGPGVPDYLGPVAELLKATHTVIRYDQRGTGDSSCEDGRYTLGAHVDDLEAVRVALGYGRIAVFGHSWGGLLAQLHFQAHPERVERIFLCNSAVGIGRDWLEMELHVAIFNRRKSGPFGFLTFLWYLALGLRRGRLRDLGARATVMLAWRNYFDPPSSAPRAPDRWIFGIRAEAMVGTRSSAVHAPFDALEAPHVEIPIFILYGKHDVYGATVTKVLGRYPLAQAVTLDRSGHLPWLQAPRDFKRELLDFFA